jgi:hypothetical protein
LEAEVRPLDGGQFIIELEDRPDVLGPLSREELEAVEEAIRDYLEEVWY